MTSESEEEDTEEEVKLEEKADDQGVEGPAPAAGEIAPEASRDKNKEKDKKAKSSEKKSKEKKAERSPSHRKSKKASRSRSHKKSKEKKAARSRSHRDRGRRRSRRQESGRDRATDRTGKKEEDQAIGHEAVDRTKPPPEPDQPPKLPGTSARPASKGKGKEGNPNGGFVEIVGVEQPHMNPLWSNIVGATNSVSRGSPGISSQKFSRRRPRGKPAASMLNVCDSRVAQTRPKLLQQIAALPHRQLPPPRAVVRSRLLRRHRLLLRATLRRRR